MNSDNSYSLSVNLFRDLISVGALGTFLLCIHELGTPFFRGFNCDDATIRYPYKDSTIPSSVCYMVGSGLNVALILTFEYLILKKDSRGANSRSQTKIYLRNVYCRLIIWFFGAVTSELFTDISKITAGRLRPHFIEVCKPIIRLDDDKEISSQAYCDSSQNQLRHEYITDYRCSGVPSMQRDARLSFMSGHSSYAAYSGAFAVFYLQAVMDLSKYGLLKPTIQVLITAASFYTGLTRISDYKHHWQDVLAGLMQGTIVATVASLYLWPAYTKYWKRTKSQVGGNEGDVGELNRVDY